MSSDEETGYGSIEITPTKVESPTSRHRVAVVASLVLFGLVVLGGSAQGMRMAFWGGEGGDDHAWDPDNWNDDDEWRMSVAASGRRLFIVIDPVDKIKEGPTNGTSS